MKSKPLGHQLYDKVVANKYERKWKFGFNRMKTVLEMKAPAFIKAPYTFFYKISLSAFFPK